MYEYISLYVDREQFQPRDGEQTHTERNNRVYVWSL